MPAALSKRKFSSSVAGVTLTIRDALPEDHATFTRFFAQLGVPDDPVPTPEQWRASCPNAIFAMSGGREVGYALAQVLESVGYVFHVVVDEPSRGRGVGRAVMSAIAARLRARGVSEWCLNVKRDNAPAIRLYGRCGMRVAYESTAMRIAWENVARLPLETEPAVVRPLAPEDDEAVERAFDLPRGRLASRRAADRVVLIATARDGRIAVAAFDPAFPGAFPFRAERATLARPLLEAMRAHARAEHDFVRVVVEADAPLAFALRDAGAETLVEMFHLRGALPNAES